MLAEELGMFLLLIASLELHIGQPHQQLINTLVVQSRPASNHDFQTAQPKLDIRYFCSRISSRGSKALIRLALISRLLSK